MSRGGRDFLLVVKGDLAEELWNTSGTEASPSFIREESPCCSP